VLRLIIAAKIPKQQNQSKSTDWNDPTLQQINRLWIINRQINRQSFPSSYPRCVSTHYGGIV